MFWNYTSKILQIKASAELLQETYYVFKNKKKTSENV